MGHCYDDWTQTTITIPIGGQVPYPTEVQCQNAGGLDMPQVMLSPLALLTLGNTDVSADIRGLWNDQARRYNIAVPSSPPDKGGQCGDGVINAGVAPLATVRLKRRMHACTRNAAKPTC